MPEIRKPTSFLPSSLLWNYCFIAYPQMFWAADSTKDQMWVNKGMLQPDTLCGCVQCLWCLAGLFAWQWELLSNTGSMHTGNVGFLEMKGCTRVFSDTEAEELEMSWDMALLPSAQYCEQVTRFLCFVNSLCARDNFRRAKPKMTTTEAMNHTVGEQNTLCRLRRASCVANKHHKFFQKDNPTGCDSEGNHPNFCEAQFLSGVTEPTETCSIVKTLASA